MAADLAAYVMFATAGTTLVVQELAAAALSGMEGADPDEVAEETIALCAVVTARTVGQVAGSEAEAALLELPFAHRDYLLGAALEAGVDKEALGGQEEVYQRLARKVEFYSVHLPSGQFPGRRALTDKMGLWMGRMSPPRLPEPPQARLERLSLVDVMLRHVKLMRVYGE